jgi:hypothetical protein
LNRKDVPRAGKYKESREVQRKLNAKNSQKRLTRLMNANFTDGDLIMTLTYADGCYPTPERARKDMTNYIKRVRTYRKKQGLLNQLIYEGYTRSQAQYGVNKAYK